MLKEYADLHCDTLSRCYERKCGPDAAGLQIRLGVPFRHLQTYAIFIPDSERDPYAYFNAVYEYGKTVFARFPELVQCRSAQEIDRAFSAGKTPFLISVEGGGFFTEHPAENERIVTDLKGKGIAFLSVCYNAGNHLAGGFHCPERGLSPLGRRVIGLLRGAGIGVDLSHLNERSADEALALLPDGVLATHSDCKALALHPRNLTDAQIRAIAEKGGLIGVNFYPPFLTPAPRAAQADILAHVRHLEQCGAGAAIAFGGDFDGIDSTPEDLCDLNGIPALAQNLYANFPAADDYLYRNARRYLNRFFR